MLLDKENEGRTGFHETTNFFTLELLQGIFN
jgi:hypothetical protein